MVSHADEPFPYDDMKWGLARKEREVEKEIGGGGVLV
jgi:hypothetical protein